MPAQQILLVWLLPTCGDYSSCLAQFLFVKQYHCQCATKEKEKSSKSQNGQPMLLLEKSYWFGYSGNGRSSCLPVWGSHLSPIVFQSSNKLHTKHKPTSSNTNKVNINMTKEKLYLSKQMNFCSCCTLHTIASLN